MNIEERIAELEKQHLSFSELLSGLCNQVLALSEILLAVRHEVKELEKEQNGLR